MSRHEYSRLEPPVGLGGRPRLVRHLYTRGENAQLERGNRCAAFVTSTLVFVVTLTSYGRLYIGSFRGGYSEVALIDSTTHGKPAAPTATGARLS